VSTDAAAVAPAANIHADRILILDFGSQYTQLIARRVREAGVYCEIHPHDMNPAALHAFAPSGVILSGGPASVTEAETPRVPPEVFELGVPVLGICYGMQALAAHFGGRVITADDHEYGYAQVRARGHSRLLRDIEDHTTSEGYGLLDVWMSHGDRVESLPDGFKLIASTDNAPVAGIGDDARGLYGIQFHPEVTHTRQGARILDRFVHDICGCRALWNPGNIIDDSIARVRAQVGAGNVLLGLSGGVDSSVVAALLHRALGDQLTCVFVDNGLLRLDEGDQVMATFAEHMGVKVIRVDAEARFLAALAGIDEPERKRKVIGNLFIEIFEEQAALLSDVAFLAQGTIYPDVIESAGASTGKAHVIKSHHNVGGLPAHMKLQLVEPLRELFKDEVRKIGVELGLPYDMVYRHPFPGPGLGVRILGQVTKPYADLLRRADAIFIEELRRHDLYDKVSQAFAVFLPVKSVGVTGDGRRYDYVVALRAVETIDFMTARWAHLPYEFLDLCSRRIINEVTGISRVTYDISGKPPAASSGSRGCSRLLFIYTSHPPPYVIRPALRPCTRRHPGTGSTRRVLPVAPQGRIPG
jgi:GMP synthase (glutamine-hydrolysing)